MTPSSRYTILGAGGSIANELVRILFARHRPLRLVSRHPPQAPAADSVAADLANLDQTVAAVAGSSVVFLLAGLKYDHKLWAELWPRIAANTVEACKRANARLVFLDNVYMYGKVDGPMTEETPFHPVSQKGEVRVRVANLFIEAWRSGNLTAMIARSADFYGPGAANGIPNALVFGPMSKGKKPMCLADDAQPHSYTYTPDAAQALVTLAESETAPNQIWNQTWHLPTASHPPTGREFIAEATRAMGVAEGYRVLRPWMVRLVGWFNPMVGEVHEMLYQNDAPYLFDSSKYQRAFGFAGTPYAEGIRATAQSYRHP